MPKMPGLFYFFYITFISLLLLAFFSGCVYLPEIKVMEEFTIWVALDALLGLIIFMAAILSVSVTAMWWSSFTVLSSWWKSHRIEQDEYGNPLPAGSRPQRFKKINSFISPISSSVLN